jgi:probable rRNA maturation factor
MIDVSFFNETDVNLDEHIKTIEELFEYALGELKIADDIEFSVIFVGDHQIREINRDYRKKDYVTDVITFALEDDVDDEVKIVGIDMPRLLGDIYISVDTTKKQAIEYEHSFLREVCFLAIHGFLHLLGYDHNTKEEEEEMFGLQRKILNQYGIKR